MPLSDDKFGEFNVNSLIADPPESEGIMIANSFNFNNIALNPIARSLLYFRYSIPNKNGLIFF